MIAEKIIAVAKTGERYATALCDRALSELGCPTVSGARSTALPKSARAGLDEARRNATLAGCTIGTLEFSIRKRQARRVQ
jgi:uncharacterized metal-binding protein